MFNYFAEQLSQAVVDGFGGSLQNIDYASTDGAMISNLLTDVYQFSAAKNYQQMAALTQALVNDDGKLRTRSEYLQEAFKINTDHVISWLDAERNTAIAGGQMASKWADIQANKDNLPLLEFDAVIDGTTTELCDSLNGTIKPVDDPFWNTYYPPNHFNCRSTVRQLSEGKITADKDIVYPEKMPPMFATNLAKDGLIFPDNHPYWNGLPKDVETQGKRELIDKIENWGKENLRDKKFDTAQIGEVEFTGNSIKEILHKGHKDEMLRNMSLYHIEPLLKKANLVQESLDIKDNVDVKKWHYLKIHLNGHSSYINIKEFKNGKKIVYAITDAIKK